MSNGSLFTRLDCLESLKIIQDTRLVRRGTCQIITRHLRNMPGSRPAWHWNKATVFSSFCYDTATLSVDTLQFHLGVFLLLVDVGSSRLPSGKLEFRSTFPVAIWLFFPPFFCLLFLFSHYPDLELPKCQETFVPYKAAPIRISLNMHIWKSWCLLEIVFLAETSHPAAAEERRNELFRQRVQSLPKIYSRSVLCSAAS